MALTVICASRGQGKTTLLRQYVAEAAKTGRSVGGIATPAVFENGRRIGYDLLDLRCGGQRPLARVVTSPDATPTIGSYRFDDDVLAAGNAAVIAAVQDGLDLIAIDEIGPLELQGRGWAPALTHALRTCRPQQELIIAVRTTLRDELPARFPSSLWKNAKRLSPPASLPSPETAHTPRNAQENDAWT